MSTDRPMAQTNATPSIEGRCQVDSKQRGTCRAAAVTEFAIVTPTLVGVQQRTVRACQHHADVLRRLYDNQIVAARPYPA